MSGSRTLKIEILGDAKSAQQAFDSIGESADRSGTKLGSLAKVGAVALAGVGIAAGAMAIDATRAFIGFQDQMNEVFTLMPGISKDAMDEMTDQVLGFSKEFGTLPEEVVPALYQSLSAGVPPNNVFEFLETAQKAAIGGVTELQTAVDGISSVINSYGSDVLDATQASDLMFTAVRLGKTDFDQLSRSLFNVVPTAQSLGVGFEDITAALATMTAQGVPTSVATTQLRQALVEASKAGGDLDTALQDLTGQSFPDLVAGGADIGSIFQDLRESMPEQEFRDLFGSVEAMNAVLGITGGNAETFASNLDEMGNSAGATEGAFDQMDTGVQRSIDKINANLAVMRLELGEKLLPVVEVLTTFLLEQGIPALSSVGDVVGDILTALAEGDFEGAFRRVVGVFEDVAGAAGGVASALGSQLVQALRDADWAGIGEAVQTKLGEALSFTVDVGSQAVDFGQGLVDDLQTALTEADWSAIGTTVQEKLGDAWTTTSETGEEGVNIGQGLVDQLSGSLEDADWSGMGATLQSNLTAALTTGEEEGSAAGQAIIDWLAGSLDAVEDWSTIGSALRVGIMGGLSVASPVLGAGVLLADLLATEITDGEGDWSEVAGNIWDKIKAGLEEVIDFGTWLVDLIKVQVEEQDWSGPADAIGSMLTAALETVEGLGEDLAGAIRERLGIGIVEMDWSAPATTLAENFAKNFDTAIKTAGLGESLRDALVLDEKDFGLLATTINEFLVPAFGDLFFEVGRAADVIATEFMPTLRNLMDALAPLGPTIETLIGIIGVLVTSAMATWAEFMSFTLVPAIQGTINIINIMISVLDILVMTWVGAVAGIKALIEGDWTTAWNIAKTVFENNYNEIVEIWERLPEVMTAPVNAAIAAVSAILNSDLTIVNAAEALLGKIKGVFAGIQAVFVEIGKQVLTGLWTGLTNPDLLGSIRSAAESIYSTVMDGLGDLPGLSPSPLGMRIGRDFGEGLVVGMLSVHDDVHRSGGSLGRAATDGASEGMAVGAGINANATPPQSGHAMGRDFGTGVGDGIADAANDPGYGSRFYDAGQKAAEATQGGWEDTWEGYDATKWYDPVTEAPSTPSGDGGGSGSGSVAPPAPANVPTGGGGGKVPVIGPTDAKFYEGPVLGAPHLFGKIFINAAGASTGVTGYFYYSWTPEDTPYVAFIVHDQPVEDLLGFLARSLTRTNRVWSSGNISTRGWHSAHSLAMAVINRVANFQGNADAGRAEDIAESFGLAPVGARLSLTSGGSTPPGGVHQPSGFGSELSETSATGVDPPRPQSNITINVTTRKADAQEIASETEAAMRFASLDPRLAGIRR